MALAVWTQRRENRAHQMTALLQSLPSFMEHLADTSEAIALTQIVQDILGAPDDLELSYIGLALQAQFGLHVLGVDEAAFAARLAAIEKTAYTFDAHVLIDFLARSSVGYDPARSLVHRLTQIGAFVWTTNLLATEVAEHAAWSISQADASTGALKPTVVAAATGRTGARSNSFVDGFVAEAAVGLWSITGLRNYLTDVLGLRDSNDEPTVVHLRSVLSQAGIEIRDLDDWDGFDQDDLVEREELQAAIGDLRRERESYRHERQVKAEAEVRLAVDRIRTGDYSLPGRELRGSLLRVEHSCVGRRRWASRERRDNA